MPSLTILPSGEILAIYNDSLRLRDLAQQLGGELTITRASHVEPVAEGWQADLAPCGGPMLPPTATRADSLAAEVEWIKENILS